jgi:TnpA family transposase
MGDIGELVKTSGLSAKKPVPKKLVNAKLVTGSWNRLVFGKPGTPKGAVDRAAYVICVLEQFHHSLKRREIYAPASSRWRDPRACLLTGKKWAAAKPAVLTALRLPEDPTVLLARHETELDTMYRDVAARLDANTAVTVDDVNRLHVAALDALDEPPSLIDLRRRVAKMLPAVDIGELILEVMAWHPKMVEAFHSVTGGEPRMGDLQVVLAAALTAHALNIGYSPITASGQLTRDRISHVDQNYLRMETYALANTPLIEAQADIELAQAGGGGMVAAVDGMRFVVPVKTIHARPNPKYFSRGKGSTWLNLVNDQSAGLAGMVVSGTPKDSLHFIDLLYRQEGGQIPDILVTDMGSYSDVVFGLVHLLDKQYRPAPADLPDERLWRTDPAADYGALNSAARGRLDLDRAARHWPEMLRVVGSIHTGEVRAFDVMRILQRDGSPTPLGDAFAHYGRVFKSRHLLTYFDDEGYRRDIKGIRNLQEGRHSLAKHLFHGKLGKIYKAYQAGMEEQLGALGLVLNCVTLWNTRYMNAALLASRPCS